MTYGVRNTYTYPDGFTVVLLDARGFKSVAAADRYLRWWWRSRRAAGLPVGGSCTARDDVLSPQGSGPDRRWY